MKNTTLTTTFIVLALVSLLSSGSMAQLPFQQVIGGADSETCNYVINTTGGGYMLAGTTFSFGSGSEDIYLVRTDDAGNIIWSKTYGGNSSDIGYCVNQNTDGGYIISGATRSFAASNYNGYLIRIDSSGNVIWSKTFNGPSHDPLHYAQQTSDGGFMAAGTLGNDVLLVKTDSSGNTVWSKTFGGSGTDIGLSAQQTNDGGYIIAGFTNSFGQGISDMYVIRTDANGDTLWTRAFGGALEESAKSIRQTSDGGFIVFGESNSFSGNRDLYLVKLDANGVHEWSRTYGGADSEFGYMVKQTNDGGYILSGTTISFGLAYWKAFLVRTDLNGDVLWSRSYGLLYSAYALSVEQNATGGYIIGGETIHAGLGQTDMYIIQTDAQGISGCNETLQSSTTTIASTITYSTSTIITSSVSSVSVNSLVESGASSLFLCSGTAINENDSMNLIEIYPNPATSGFNIKTDFTSPFASIRIYDMKGKMILDLKNVYDQSIYISTHDLNAGLYMLEVLPKGGASIFRKINVVR